ncbi:MAG: hypothetical protein IIA92_13215 [Chloroflexi bacterium]|nr:hypothetical protein [Chloroflexota bacterium]
MYDHPCKTDLDMGSARSESYGNELPLRFKGRLADAVFVSLTAKDSAPLARSLPRHQWHKTGERYR